MSELKDKSVDTIREMLFELSCNEDIDSNEFDIQFENEQEVTQGFSVNINELAGVSVTTIDKLTARNAELEGALKHVLLMQIRGFIVLGDEFTNMATEALKDNS